MRRIELKIKEDVYKDNGDGKKLTLIKKNAVCRIKPFIEDIRLIGTVLDRKGNEEKNFCKIYLRDVGFITVNHSYEELDKIQHEHINGRTSKQVGFGNNRKGN